MLICVFSDIHGNDRFFDAALRHWEKLPVDAYLFLGDAIGYFPNGKAVINQLKTLSEKRDLFFIKGNHDAMLLGELPIPQEKEKVYQLTTQQKELSQSEQNWIKSWQTDLKIELDGKQFRLVHGLPENPLQGYAYEDSAIAAWDDPQTDFLCFGQTHRPWIRKNTHTTLVNPGSIGLPRDRGDRLSFALIDTKTGAGHTERVDATAERDFWLQQDVIHPIVKTCLLRGTK